MHDGRMYNSDIRIVTKIHNLLSLFVFVIKSRVEQTIHFYNKSLY